MFKEKCLFVEIIFLVYASLLFVSCGESSKDTFASGSQPALAGGPSAGNPLPIGGPGVFENPPAPSPSPFAQQVFILTNEFRQTQGVAPLFYRDQLILAAQNYAESMGVFGFFSHTSPTGDGPAERIQATGYRARTWGENIARGQKSPQDVVTAWINSPGHRANMLNAQFKDLGVGYALGASGPYWVQDFGAESLKK